MAWQTQLSLQHSAQRPLHAGRGLAQPSYKQDCSLRGSQSVSTQACSSRLLGSVCLSPRGAASFLKTGRCSLISQAQLRHGAPGLHTEQMLTDGGMRESHKRSRSRIWDGGEEHLPPARTGCGLDFLCWRTAPCSHPEPEALRGQKGEAEGTPKDGRGSFPVWARTGRRAFPALTAVLPPPRGHGSTRACSRRLVLRQKTQLRKAGLSAGPRTKPSHTKPSPTPRQLPAGPRPESAVSL